MKQPHEVLAEDMEKMFNLGRAAAREQRPFEPICKPGISMEEAPLEPHVTGSRPNSCFTCMRARDSIR